MTTSPQRRYLPAIPPVRGRRAPLTPVPSPPSSVIAWAWYVDGVRRPAESLTAAARQACAGEGFVWLGLKDPHDSDLLGLPSRSDLHPLAVEDAVQGHARSKLEVFDNDLMRKISSWVAIVAVPTMIAGIYGMNFANMPELNTRYGYYVVLGVIAAVMLGLYVGFKCTTSGCDSRAPSLTTAPA